MVRQRRQKRGESGDLLDRALRAWKRGSESDQALGARARARIVDRALASTATGPRLASLFPARRSLLLATVVPALLGIALVAGLQFLPLERADAATQVQAYKAGDQVVFTIANGKREHFVYRSDRADRFDARSRVRVTDGIYRDSLASGDLVFYRID